MNLLCSIFAVLTVVLSLGVFYLVYKLKEKSNSFSHDSNQNDYDFINEIYKILASISIPFEERLNSIAKEVKEYYKFKNVVISLIENDHLKIVNQQSRDKDLLRDSVISFSNTKNLIDKSIIKDFIDSEDQRIHTLKKDINGIYVHEVINLSIKSHQSDEKLGVMTLIFETKPIERKIILNSLNLVCKNIAFNIFLEKEERNTLEEMRNTQKEETIEESLIKMILNVSQMHSKLLLEIKRVKRYESMLSAIILKVNLPLAEFKKLEIEVINTIQQSIRDVDMFGMWDDNSYLILLPETNIFGAKKVAQKLKNKIVDEKSLLKLSVKQFNTVEKDSEEKFRNRLNSALNSSEKKEFKSISLE